MICSSLICSSRNYTEKELLEITCNNPVIYVSEDVYIRMDKNAEDGNYDLRKFRYDLVQWLKSEYPKFKTSNYKIKVLYHKFLNDFRFYPVMKVDITTW